MANCSAFEVNHRRLGVHFAVHFLPMPCYRWLGGCGGVQFFGVFVLLRKPPFYGLQELLLSFYGLRKVRYMLTICAVCLPVCRWYVCLSNGLTWRYGAIKKGMAKITIPHHACLKHQNKVMIIKFP